MTSNSIAISAVVGAAVQADTINGGITLHTPPVTFFVALKRGSWPPGPA